jgi:drug/metabolite transporter (DMT)-like permease
VLQKKAIDRLPPSRPRVSALVRSAGWMTGLLVTGIGWAFYVFGLQKVPVSAARTITGGSYVVLALFSMFFLRVPLRLPEWGAIVMVSAGIAMLGLGETAGLTPGAAAFLAAPGRSVVALGCVGIIAVGLYMARRLPAPRMRSLLPPLVVFAALSGLLSSVGDLFVKVLLFTVAARPWLGAASAIGLVVSYLAGFYMLSRAYQAGTMVGGVVISDFFARVGAIGLGAVALAEPLAGQGTGGALRAAGFLLVLGGSLLLGRFSGSAVGRTGA